MEAFPCPNYKAQVPSEEGQGEIRNQSRGLGKAAILKPHISASFHFQHHVPSI